MKKAFKNITKIVLGLFSAFLGIIVVYWGSMSYLAFKLDILHLCGNPKNYCMIPHFDFCLLALSLSLALFCLGLYVIRKW